MTIKSVVDYLTENGNFVDCIGVHEVLFELYISTITMTVDGKMKYYFYADDKFGAQIEIQDTLYNYHKTEIRFCEECGKPYDRGYMAGDGYWYCCEDCFDDSMNKSYGKGKWRGTDEEGYYGGYYEALQDDGEWEDTGIFYTEWN